MGFKGNSSTVPLRLRHLDCSPVNTPPPAAPPLKQGRNWLSVRTEGAVALNYPCSLLKPRKTRAQNCETMGRHKTCPYRCNHQILRYAQDDKARIIIAYVMLERSEASQSTLHFDNIRFSQPSRHLDCSPVNTPPPTAPPLKQGRNCLSENNYKT